MNDILEMFPDAIVTYLDPNHIQGIPDMLILWERQWATLEGKKATKSRHQPNQDYYVAMMNDMSFSAVIYPENKEEVLNDLQSTFRSRQQALVSKRK